MMRKRMLLLFATMFLILVGCSNDAAYEEAIEEGLSYIEETEYLLAEESFEKALELKPDDEYATNLLTQTKLIQQAYEQFENEEIKEALATIEEIIEIEEGSEHIVSRVEELQEEIEALLEKLEQFEASLDEVEQLLEKEEVEEATQLINNILEEELEHAVFAQIKKRAESLLEEAQRIQERMEKERQEAERKAAEEKARKEAEEKARKEAEHKKQAANITGYWLKVDEDLSCHVTTTYMTCALAYSDFITYDRITNIHPISSTEVEVTTEDGHTTLFTLSNNNNTLQTPGGTFNRVTKEAANAIFDGYYELD